MSNEELDDEVAVSEALRRDPLVQATVERSLAPYVRVASPALLRIMREIVEEALTSDPYAVALLRRMQADRAKQEGRPAGESRTGVRGGAAAHAAADVAPSDQSRELVRGGAEVEEAPGLRGRRGEGA